MSKYKNLHPGSGLVGFRGKVFFLLLTTGLFIVLAFGCTGGPEPKEQVCPPKPGWISSPQQDGYYVGVGSADTGSKAENRPVAEARARGDLASRISATIVSELEIEATASSTESTERVSENLTQSVEANLKDIETVDTYHCPGEGSWVFVRLSKARWAEIQENRRKDLEERLKELINPVIESKDRTFVLSVKTFLKGQELIYESPIGAMAKGTLAGEEGIFFDIISEQVNKAFETLDLKVDRERISLSVGEEAELHGSLKSSLYPNTGNVKISVKKKGEELITTTQTRKNGSFTLRFPEGFRRPGEQHIVVTPSFDNFDNYREYEIIPKDTLPEREVVFAVKRVPVGLKMDSSSQINASDYSGQVKSLFTDRGLPLEFSEAGSNQSLPLLIRFDLLITDMPENKALGLFFSRAKAVIEFERNGKSIHSYESEEKKDGGLNREQARTRAVSKLFTGLEEEDELFERLEEAIVTR